MIPITYKPNPSCEGGMEVHRYGRYVSLKEFEKLKAEVERLRKAGDAMLLCLTAYVHGVPYKIKIVSECSERWIEAKEGKPSA